MRAALAVAQQASASGDVPVGAVIVNNAGEVIATGHNERELNNDPTAQPFSSHAPNTRVEIRDCAIAPAHIGHGSNVTTMV